MILKTTTSGIITNTLFNNNSLPTDFMLYQNYPNPFNPGTVIRYSLIENRDVNLKVFNALGKEVVILVNEKQPAGTYEVNFDASNYPSGVYYYHRAAGDFVETKKMLLIK